MDNYIFIGLNGIIIALYIDDLLIIKPFKEGIATLKEALNKQFYILNIGLVYYYLSINII